MRKINTYTIGQSKTWCASLQKNPQTNNKKPPKPGIKSPVNMISKYISTALEQKALRSFQAGDKNQVLLFPAYIH